MAESELHRFLKKAAAETLEEEGFRIYFEPLWPPVGLLEWEKYRPDIFGVRSKRGADVYAFVECETNPNPKRILAKNIESVMIQTKLLRKTKSRKILAIPAAKANTLDSSVKKYWEVWKIKGPSRFQQT